MKDERLKNIKYLYDMKRLKNIKDLYDTKDERLKNIKDIYEKFDLQNRNWITECVTIYSKNRSHKIEHPFSDRVEFKLINEKLYVVEVFKNVSQHNGEEIVSYSDGNKHCLDELYEKGVIVGFEIADWAFTGRPAEIRIDYKDVDYKPLLVWNIIEKM